MGMRSADRNSEPHGQGFAGEGTRATRVDVSTPTTGCTIVFENQDEQA
jgi:hypothetical protein